jgi:hypothetical protein
MTIPLVTILVGLLIFALVLWAIRQLVPHLGLPSVVVTILYVVVVVIFVFWLLSVLGLWSGGGTVRVGELRAGEVQVAFGGGR